MDGIFIRHFYVHAVNADMCTQFLKKSIKFGIKYELLRELKRILQYFISHYYLFRYEYFHVHILILFQSFSHRLKVFFHSRIKQISSLKRVTAIEYGYLRICWVLNTFMP